MTHLNEKALLEMAAKLEMKADKLESYDHLVSEVKEAMGQWAQRARGRRGLKPWWSREVAEAIQCRQQVSHASQASEQIRGSRSGSGCLGDLQEAEIGCSCAGAGTCSGHEHEVHGGFEGGRKEVRHHSLSGDTYRSRTRRYPN